VWFVAMTTEHDAGETAGEVGGDGERNGGAREKLCRQNQDGQGEDVLPNLIVCSKQTTNTTPGFCLCHSRHNLTKIMSRF